MSAIVFDGIRYLVPKNPKLEPKEISYYEWWNVEDFVELQEELGLLEFDNEDLTRAQIVSWFRELVKNPKYDKYVGYYHRNLLTKVWKPKPVQPDSLESAFRISIDWDRLGSEVKQGYMDYPDGEESGRMVLWQSAELSSDYQEILWKIEESYGSEILDKVKAVDIDPWEDKDEVNEHKRLEIFAKVVLDEIDCHVGCCEGAMWLEHGDTYERSKNDKNGYDIGFEWEAES